jgi:hypothetical protein
MAMRFGTVLLAATAATILGAGAAAAQQAAGDTGLPTICTAGSAGAMAPGHDMGMGGSAMPGRDMASGMGGGAGEAMDKAHRDLMQGMPAMQSGMMQGMMAEDADVAFVCGMIPHHQGAIDMARAELQNGKDQWARDMAQKIIDAQEAEIAALRDWLAARK